MINMNLLDGNRLRLIIGLGFNDGASSDGACDKTL